jgi:large subunit ribosomal protein L17
MRHRHRGVILKREKGQRKALLHSLVRALVLKEAIVTTEAKAKAARPQIEKLITKAKKGTLANHRIIVSEIGKDAASRLKNIVLPRLASRSSGYVRITKQGARTSDAARMARISFVE